MRCLCVHIMVVFAVSFMSLLSVGAQEVLEPKPSGSHTVDTLMLDSVISASTLVAAGIFLTCQISLEAWLGAIISVVIIKAGIDMLRETLSKILGERNDMELAKEIKKTIAGFAGVRGAYDLVLHNYGPDTWQGSVQS